MGQSDFPFAVRILGFTRVRIQGRVLEVHVAVTQFQAGAKIDVGTPCAQVQAAAVGQRRAGLQRWVVLGLQDAAVAAQVGRSPARLDEMDSRGYCNESQVRPEDT